MANFVKIGETVALDPVRVKVARINLQPTELRMILRDPDETLFVAAPQGVATAREWLDDLAVSTQLSRVGDALLPIPGVQLAQVQEKLVVQVKGQAQDRGPGVRLTMDSDDLDNIDLPAESMKTARAWLDTLLRKLNGEDEEGPAAPVGEPPPADVNSQP